MLWSDFYDDFWDWSDATRGAHIASLEDIGIGEEVVEVIYEIEDPVVRTQLIRTAIKFGSKFTFEDFQNLEDELSDDVYRPSCGLLAEKVLLSGDGEFFPASFG